MKTICIFSEEAFFFNNMDIKCISSPPHITVTIDVINKVIKDLNLDCPAGVDLLLVKAFPLLAVLVLIKEEKNLPIIPQRRCVFSQFWDQ